MKLDSSTGSTPPALSKSNGLTTSPFTINKVLLTDEESNEAQWEAYKNQPVGEAVTYEVGEKAIAKAQARKLVEWLEAEHLCPSRHDYRIIGTIRRDEEHREDCHLCKWQALKKALEV